MTNEEKNILKAASKKIYKAARHCIKAGNDCTDCPFFKPGNYNTCYQKFMQFTIAFAVEVSEVLNNERGREKQ